jgi:hypothetical protein
MLGCLPAFLYPPITGSITRDEAVDVAAESTRLSNRLRDALDFHR